MDLRLMGATSKNLMDFFIKGFLKSL